MILMDQKEPAQSQSQEPLSTSGDKTPNEKKSSFISHRILITILIVFIVLFLVGSGWAIILLQKQTSKSEEEPLLDTVSTSEDQTQTLNQQPTKSPSQQADETKNWNTFINSKYNYLIKYPLEWTVQKKGQLEPKVPDYVVFNPPDSATNAAIIRISYSTRTYEEANELSTQFGQPIIVASQSGIRKVLQDSNGDISINVILPFNQNSIILYSKEKYSEIFALMLSTFRFL